MAACFTWREVAWKYEVVVTRMIYLPLMMAGVDPGQRGGGLFSCGVIASQQGWEALKQTSRVHADKATWN